MKVVIFLPNLNGGGAERAMVSLANGLAEKNYTVELVLSKAVGPYLEEVSSKVGVVDLNKERVFFCIYSLSEYMKKSKPDVVISALTHANMAAILAFCISRIKAKIFVSERSNLTQSLKENNSFLNRVFYKVAAFLYKKVDLIICVSRGVANDVAHLLKVPESKLRVIYNPVVDDELFKLAEEPVAHRWLENKNKPVVLAVGRLIKAKDYPTLIKAFKKVREQIDCRLIILGEGSERGTLERLVSELGLAGDVEMPGFISNPYAWMKRADLYVMSSVREGLPNTLIQAMACNARVISTDCPSGPREILENGKWGELVPVGDHELLSNAMFRCLTSELELKTLDRAMFFSKEKCVCEYNSLLN